MPLTLFLFHEFQTHRSFGGHSEDVEPEVLFWRTTTVALRTRRGEFYFQELSPVFRSLMTLNGQVLLVIGVHRDDGAEVRLSAQRYAEAH